MKIRYAILGALLLGRLAWAQPEYDRLTLYFHEGKYEQLIAEGEPLAKKWLEDGNKDGAAQIYQMLTIVYMRLGRKDDMMRCNAIAKGQQAAANQNSSDPQTRQRALCDKASSLFSSGDLDATVKFVDQQLASWPADSAQRYWIFKPKFHALWLQKDQQSAMAALAQETEGLEARLLQDPANAKYYHANLGLTYLLGSMALAYHDQARSIELGKKAEAHLTGPGGCGVDWLPGAPNLPFRLAAASGRYADALQLADQYAAQFQNSPNHQQFYRYQTQGRRGYWLEQLGKDREALDQYLEAINFLDGAWSGLKLRENKQSLVSNFDQGEFLLPASLLFERAIALAVKLGEDRKALELSELYKSRSLRDSLSRQGLEQVQPAGVPANLLQQERDLYKQLALKPQPQTIQSYLEVLASIRAKAPEYANLLSGDPGKLRLPALGEKDVLVEYFVGEHETTIFVVHPDGDIKSVVSALGRDDLQHQVQETRKSIKLLGSERGLKRQLKALSQSLIAPVEPQLAGAQRVIFVPHGDLHALPFSALLSGDGKYLLENYEVVEAPSTYSLSFGQQKNPRRRPGFDPDKASCQIFALGDFKSGDWAPLPGTRQEAQTMQALLPKAKVLMGDQLKHAEILQLLPHSSLVHFATHGYLNAGNPLDSGLVTADQPVTAGEILTEQLNTYSVFLSACETALGKQTGADELVGLQQSFEYAGTPSIIASLWQISDQATAVLVDKFYRGLEAEPKATALREAQLALLNEPQFKHPYYWSAFVLSGDWI